MSAPAKMAVGRSVPGEQLLCAEVAALLGVAGGDDVDLVGEAVGAHGLPVAVGADGVGHLREAGRVGLEVLDVGDPAVTESDEVVDDEAGAGEVVVGDRVVRRRTARAGRRRRSARCWRRARGGIATTPGAIRIMPSMLRSIIASVTRASASSPLQPRAEQHLVVGVAEPVGHAVEDVGEERVADVGQHHADGVGLAAHAPGRGVGPVARARRSRCRTFARIAGLAP